MNRNNNYAAVAFVLFVWVTLLILATVDIYKNITGNRPGSFSEIIKNIGLLHGNS